MIKRLFIAIKASEHLKHNIKEIQKENRKRLSDLQWTPVEDIHIVLVPPGIVADEEKGLEIIEHLFFAPFDLIFNAVEFVPHVPYKVLWLKAEPNKQFLELKRALANTFNFNQRFSSTAFMILARSNSFPRKNYSKKVNWIEEVRSIQLMEATLTPFGVEYSTVASVPFAYDFRRV